MPATLHHPPHPSSHVAEPLAPAHDPVGVPWTRYFAPAVEFRGASFSLCNRGARRLLSTRHPVFNQFRGPLAASFS